MDEVQLAVIAAHLGLSEEVESLYRSCQRFDLLNEWLQVTSRWQSAIQVSGATQGSMSLPVYVEAPTLHSSNCGAPRAGSGRSPRLARTGRPSGVRGGQTLGDLSSVHTGTFPYPRLLHAGSTAIRICCDYLPARGRRLCWCFELRPMRSFSEHRLAVSEPTPCSACSVTWETAQLA